jgi:hypothetical protein
MKKIKQSCDAKSYFKLVLNKLKVTMKRFFSYVYIIEDLAQGKIYQNIMKDFKNISN